MNKKHPPLPNNGFHYIGEGWRLARLSGIRRYVIVPLIVNILLLGGAFVILFHQLGHWIPQLLSYIPHWLQWLSYLLWPLAVLSIILIFSYFFSTLANWLAAPFCGLLAEQLEARLSGQAAPDSGWLALVDDFPRIMKREWQKFTYYLPRAALLLCVHFIPVVGQFLAPVLWFVFGAWMMAIQYSDYPFDNHKISFIAMRQDLAQDRKIQLQFGGLVSLFTLIPLVNLVIMPVAVCGATALWVDRYRGRVHT